MRRHLIWRTREKSRYYPGKTCVWPHVRCLGYTTCSASKNILAAMHLRITLLDQSFLNVFGSAGDPSCLACRRLFSAFAFCSFWSMSTPIDAIVVDLFGVLSLLLLLFSGVVQYLLFSILWELSHDDRRAMRYERVRDDQQSWACMLLFKWCWLIEKESSANIERRDTMVTFWSSWFLPRRSGIDV